MYHIKYFLPRARLHNLCNIRLIQPFNSARKICYNMYEFICSKRANTFGKLAYKDWIDFCAIDPLVFYNDYYGMIDANNDGKERCRTETHPLMLWTNQIERLIANERLSLRPLSDNVNDTL